MKKSTARNMHEFLTMLDGKMAKQQERLAQKLNRIYFKRLFGIFAFLFGLTLSGWFCHPLDCWGLGCPCVPPPKWGMTRLDERACFVYLETMSLDQSYA